MKSTTNGSMRVKMGGCRGSLPVAGPQYARTGGNTTSIRVYSECLPKSMALIIDGGTGFMPLSQEALTGGVESLMILLTHHHHDHNQGFFIAGATFNSRVKKMIWGPVEGGYGPERTFRSLMRPPFHPIHAEKVLSSFEFKNLRNPSASVILFHPSADSPVLMPLDKYARAISTTGTGLVSFGGNNLQKIRECLLVRMYYSNHPERTICYRFEELPTGKIFVFLTDHENMAELPASMQRHLENAGLLIMDSQYDAEKYLLFTKGFGHGTPEYCVQTAMRCGAIQLGLTHHDPSSSDQYLEETILSAALAEQSRLSITSEHGLVSLNNIFICTDNMVIDV